MTQLKQWDEENEKGEIDNNEHEKCQRNGEKRMEATRSRTEV